jgi:hypothetical protein
MHLGQKMSVHSLSTHGERVSYCEKTQSRNCASRYVHELKIIYKTTVSSRFYPPAHISLFVSEQNLHHESFSKISVKTLNRPLSHEPKADRIQFMQRAFLFSQTSMNHGFNALPMGSQPVQNASSRLSVGGSI